MSDLTVISVASPKWAVSDKVKICQKILKKQGFNTYLEVDDGWRGWRSKITFYTEAVKKLGSKYVMFLDAADVIALAGPDEVIETYKELDHPWVYAAERNIWPRGSFKPDDYPPSESRYRYLNSGAYIGDREYIIEIYRDWTNNWTANYDAFWSEQFWVAQNYMRDQDSIRLDTGCKLFQCMAGAWNCEASPGRLYNPETDTYPLLVHFNGGVNIYKNPTAKTLWSSLV